MGANSRSPPENSQAAQAWQVMQRRQGEKESNELYRRRLLKIIRKKFTTCFIGDIALIEEFFGILWGHGKAYQDKTEQERQWFELWQELRGAILNNGNAQLRAVDCELQNHEVHWNRYRLQAVASANRGGTEEKEKE